MDAFDLFIVGHVKTHFYCRFVDDCLAVVSPDDAPRLLDVSNAWHTCIKTENAVQPSQSVSYLDLSLGLSMQTNNILCSVTGSFRTESVTHVTHALYRKPLNAYQYLPRTSCHPAGVFSGLIFGEALRILKRCECPVTASRELAFFASKLVAKGYQYNEIHVVFDRVRNRKRLHPLGLVRKAFIKIKHSSNVNYRYLNRLLRQLSSLHSSDTIIAKSVQHSLFRLLYPRMWPSNSPGSWRAG